MNKHVFLLISPMVRKQNRDSSTYYKAPKLCVNDKYFGNRE